MDKDLYEILGVKKEANDGEIRKAFLKLAKKYHPDHNPGNKDAEQRFKEVNLAYEVLKDSKKRTQYDQMKAHGQNPFARAAHAGNYGWGGGQSGGFSGDFGDFGLGDLFEEIFGGRGGMGARRGGPRGFQARGQDSIARIRVPFLEAARGGEMALQLGGGKKVTVKIPEGVSSGSKIKLKGQGEPGLGGGPNGDLILEIEVDPHPYFVREGDNVLLRLPLSFSEAVLGTEIEVPTINGKVHVTIPKGVSSGQQLKLKGKGILSSTGVRGDQLVELSIKLPKPLPESYIKTAEDLKTDSFNPRKDLF